MDLLKLQNFDGVWKSKKKKLQLINLSLSHDLFSSDMH